jgi:hypothetical protein
MNLLVLGRGLGKDFIGVSKNFFKNVIHMPIMKEIIPLSF